MRRANAPPVVIGRITGSLVASLERRCRWPIKAWAQPWLLAISGGIQRDQIDIAVSVSKQLTPNSRRINPFPLFQGLRFRIV